MTDFRVLTVYYPKHLTEEEDLDYGITLICFFEESFYIGNVSSIFGNSCSRQSYSGSKNPNLKLALMPLSKDFKR
jgi:hypothetical protein